MTEQQSYDSNFFLWGKRDYVQGGHIIYQLIDAMRAWGFPDVERIIASFRFQLHEQGAYLLFNESSTKTEKENYCATFKVESGCSLYSVALIGNGKPIEKVLPDDESELISNCTINKRNKVASVKIFSISRFVNVIIALNKRLHHETIDSGGFGAWILAKFSLNFKEINLVQSTNLSLRLDNIIGDRMTKSSIEIDRTKTGEIFFTRKPIA